MIETEYNIILSRIQPIRIISLISLSWGIFNWGEMSDPSLMSFYCFIFLYVASFVAEWVLTSPLNGFRKRLVSLGTKFIQMLPVEFAGIAGSALLLFAPSTVRTSHTIELLAVVGVCWLGIELYHMLVVPHLNRIKFTPQTSMLAVVGMTLLTFIQGFYYLILSPHHLVFIQ